jgi:hypothetical protein
MGRSVLRPYKIVPFADVASKKSLGLDVGVCDAWRL